jgi:hypothetical protein
MKTFFNRQIGGEILDKYEEEMEKMSKMTEKERMKAVEETRAQCICPECPTYNECAKEKNQLYYCGIGESPTCIIKEQGCICPACTVTEKMGYTNQFFCTRGTEKEQRGME